MSTHALLGALLGLIAGLVFGVIIQYINTYVTLAPDSDGPHVIAPFLGMGFGTLVGAILGGLVGLKQK
jgi:fructose-specific phosphotransferase system IIC component